MSFQPVLPVSGYAGWKFLGRTLEAQKAAFNESPEIQRDSDYFHAHIAEATTAEALVSDRRLLKVALGAFGLDDDINSKAFIRKVLEEGTLEGDALANKLTDKRYAALANAFGYHLGTPSTQLSDFADTILNAYDDHQFEIALGEQDNNMRLALALGRDLGEVAEKSSSEETKWYSVMGNTQLRAVFEGALGLPSSFASLDLDQQLATLQKKTEAVFGDASVSQFTSSDMTEKLVRLFLVRAEIAEGASSASSSSAALQILQAGTAQDGMAQDGAAGILSILSG